MDYNEFIESKKHTSDHFGFDATWYPSMAFDFQKEIIRRAVRKGRMAVFADTGLGKTLMQLSIARNVADHTGGKVLILTPLAVAQQFVSEAEFIECDGVYHSKDGSIYGDIVIANYERLHYFDPNYFECCICDESSILKNFDGKTKGAVTTFMKKMSYRFLFTATPSPNDYIELGTSSEALGYMGYTDMLGRFFTNRNRSIDARHTGDKWYLKPHANDNFWEWVNTWSISIKKPSDMGFSDEGYNLPELIEKYSVVQNKTPLPNGNQTTMFAMKAKGFHEIRAEQRCTIEQRCDIAIERAKGKVSVYWCNLNDEANYLQANDPEAVQIKGGMSVEKKEKLLSDFANGDIKRLITKAKITSFGLNWQHCNHTVFFPTYSYEQYYQAIRRFWRFGQKNDVIVDIVLSDGMESTMNALRDKKQMAEEMFDMIVKNTNGVYEQKEKRELQNFIIPNFI